MKTTADLGKDSVRSLVLKLALPAMVAQFVMYFTASSTACTSVTSQETAPWHWQVPVSADPLSLY